MPVQKELLVSTYMQHSKREGAPPDWELAERSPTASGRAHETINEPAIHLLRSLKPILGKCGDLQPVFWENVATCNPYFREMRRQMPPTKLETILLGNDC